MPAPDISTIVSESMKMLVVAAPFLSAAGKSASTEMGKKATGGAIILSKRLMSWFVETEDVEAEQTLSLFLNNPQSFKGALSDILKRVLEEHPEWAAEVAGLVDSKLVQELDVGETGEADEVVQRQIGVKNAQQGATIKGKVGKVRQDQRDS